MTTKVAILGGGVGAMSAAFELTAPCLGGAYDVTVYQMGWRLGGKGASGRNQAVDNRIQEHGLHIWMGFYENAFRVMRECYGELGRAPGTPLATWQDAWKPHSYIVLEEQLADGSFHPWEFNFPTNSQNPGDGAFSLPDLWGYFQSIFDWLRDRWSEGQSFVPPTRGAVAAPVVPDWVRDEHAKAVAGKPATRGLLSGFAQNTASFYLSWAMDIFGPLSPDPATHTESSHNALIWLIDAFMTAAWVLLGGNAGSDFGTNKLWVEINLAGAAAAGFLRDGLLVNGFNVINDVDFRDWLVRNGANDITAESGPLRGIYDLVFGFVGGDTKRGRLSAGVAVYGILRMLLTYRGAIFWEMQAGMGDTVFGPLYQVLSARGVTFEFFHRVTNLHLTGDGQNIGAIDLVQQVKLVGDSYDPLIPVLDLPCWPSAPLYDQIQNGDDLKASGINLESAWAVAWRDEGPLTLALGTDFDKVVLGISLAGLPYISAELVANSKPFADMLSNLQSTQTFGYQLWLTPDLAGLGWKKGIATPEAPVLTAFAEPIDTWGDLSHLLARETWSGPVVPQSSAYFCGPFTDAADIPPAFTGNPLYAGFPAAEKARFNGIAQSFLDSGVGQLWPLAVNGDGKFNRDLLVSQYERVNIDPTERYVLSVPGSTQFRLKAHASGFDNLYLAGDWTENVINASCVEAATISGLRAAQAISGYPAVIAGDVP